MSAVLIPIALKYGPILVAYGVGHIVGWFHHKAHAAKQAATPATPTLTGTGLPPAKP